MVTSIELQIRREGEPLRRATFQSGSYLFGRSLESDVVLGDEGVSRQHARLVIENSSAFVEDLSSQNGVYVDGNSVVSHRLKGGEIITIGPFNLEVLLSVGEPPSSSAHNEKSKVAWLDLAAGSATSKTSYPVPASGAGLGRSTTNDIIVADERASRLHCRIGLIDGVWRLSDAGSANGVLVNGLKLRSSMLVEGDIITIGRTDYRFRAPKNTQGLDSITEKKSADHDLYKQKKRRGSEPWPDLANPLKKRSKVSPVLVVVLVLALVMMALVALVLAGSAVYYFKGV